MMSSGLVTSRATVGKLRLLSLFAVLSVAQ